MTIDKFYFYKAYDQWKGKTLSIYNTDDNTEIYNYQMYFMDIDTSKVIHINATIKSNDATYSTECIIANAERRIVELPLILSLLNKDVLYQVVFTMTLYDNTTIDSYIQTFKTKERNVVVHNESKAITTSYVENNNYTKDMEDYSFMMLNDQLSRVEKMYMHRKYNQWRGKPLFVEDEDKKNGIYIQFTDLEMARGFINIIYAEIKDINGGVYSIGSTIEDYNKKLVKFILPNEVISNNGLYEVTFGVAYNTEGTEKVITYRSAIQTFTILDTVESNDSEVVQESHYPILLQLIEEISGYKVDTSNFPTYADVQEMIGEKFNQVSIEVILKTLNDKGYITQTQLDKILIGQFVMKSELSNYVNQSEFKSAVTWIRFLNEYDKYYARKTDLNGYVLKEEGKGLSTHDLTDELYEKIINSNAELSQDVIDRLKTFITKEQFEQEMTQYLNTFYAIYYTKEEIEQMFLTINNFNIEKEELIQKIDEAITPIELEEYRYLTNNDVDDVLEDYYTKTEIDNTFITKDDIGNFDFDVDLSDYYTKTESDTKFATKNEIVKIDDETPSLNTTYSSEIIEQKIIDVDDNVLDLETRVEYLEDKQMDIINFDGSYNSLTGKPTIPSLDDYAKTEDIPTKTSQLTNDSGFLTLIPSEYITDEELDEKGYLTEHQDLSSYAKKTEIDDKITTINNNITNQVNTINGNVNKKVDKVEGMGLSQNSYTTDEKTKLANIRTITTAEIDSIMDEIFK